MKLPDKEWVGLFCDGQWSAAAEQAYDHWYCGLEKIFLLLGVGYLVAMFFLELSVPAPALNAYLQLFAPLHDWTREHLYIAGKHSADLTAHGYGHRVGFLVHYEMVTVFIALVAPILFYVGGNDWVIKWHVKFLKRKKVQYLLKEIKKICGKFFFCKKFYDCLFHIWDISFLFRTARYFLG